MRLRREEDRALRGLLPDDVKADAVRLNVASRASGGASIITPSRVRELGEGGVRDIVTRAGGDPSRAARLVADRTIGRAKSDRGDRER